MAWGKFRSCYISPTYQPIKHKVPASGKASTPLTTFTSALFPPPRRGSTSLLIERRAYHPNLFNTVETFICSIPFGMSSMAKSKMMEGSYYILLSATLLRYNILRRSLTRATFRKSTSITQHLAGQDNGASFTILLEPPYALPRRHQPSEPP